METHMGKLDQTILSGARELEFEYFFSFSSDHLHFRVLLKRITHQPRRSYHEFCTSNILVDGMTDEPVRRTQPHLAHYVSSYYRLGTATYQ